MKTLLTTFGFSSPKIFRPTDPLPLVKRLLQTIALCFLCAFFAVSAHSQSLPAAPANLVGSGGNTQASLSWSAVTGASSYKVKRTTGSGSTFSTLATVPAGPYTDTGLTNGTTYIYVVTAVNATGESGNSNQISVTPQGIAPSAPGSPSFSNIAPVSVTVNAPALPANSTSLNLQQKLSSASNYVTVATGLAGSSATNVTGLSVYTSYSFRFIAAGPWGRTTGSANSVTTSNLPTPGSPSFSSITPITIVVTAPALPPLMTDRKSVV